MVINSKAPITANNAIKPDKAPSRPVKGKAAVMASKCQPGAKPLTVARLRAIKKQLKLA